MVGRLVGECADKFLISGGKNQKIWLDLGVGKIFG
jgi:hypothetical protein